MALDTREKRMNAARVGRPWMRAKDTTGSFDEQARIASGNGYGGNALTPPAASTQVMPIMSDAGIHNAVFHGLVCSGGQG